MYRVKTVWFSDLRSVKIPACIFKYITYISFLLRMLLINRSYVFDFFTFGEKVEYNFDKTNVDFTNIY